MIKTNYRRKVFILLALGSFVFVNLYMLHGCKKYELDRVAAVLTKPVGTVTENQAWVYGDIIDVGDNDEVTDFGFCWAPNKSPTILDASHGFGSRNYTGSYYFSISGLIHNSEYIVRAYVKDGSDVYYGDTVIFKTKLGNITLPSVSTSVVSNITNVSAISGGNVTSNGNSTVTNRGVCWATFSNPTISNSYTSNGSGTGVYTSSISGLNPETTYYVTAYATNAAGTAYGTQRSFTTLAGVPPTGEWLHYDNGINNDNGIGLTEGGSFDVAIRIPAADLLPYNGFKLKTIKFFPRVGSPVEYSVTLWEGTNMPMNYYLENVLFPIINTWNEFYLSDDYYINASTDLWVGYWVQNQPPDMYPAGVDAGPAYTGYGDMISMDDGNSWDALSELNPDLDFNWNLQAYVTNEKGEEIPIIKRPVIKRELSDYLPEGNIVSQIASQRNK